MTVPALPLVVSVLAAAAATICSMAPGGVAGGGWAEVIDDVVPCAVTLPLPGRRERCHTRRRSWRRRHVYNDDDPSDATTSVISRMTPLRGGDVANAGKQQGGPSSSSPPPPSLLDSSVGSGDEIDVSIGGGVPSSSAVAEGKDHSYDVPSSSSSSAAVEDALRLPHEHIGDGAKTTTSEEDKSDEVERRRRQRRASASIPTTTTVAPRHHLLPWIDARTVSLALRMTCEVNRRLSAATTGSSGGGSGSGSGSEARFPIQRPPTPGYRAVANALGGISRSGDDDDDDERSLTIFHTPKPHRDDSSVVAAKRGTSRWGPDLEGFLDTLLSSIGLGGDGPCEDGVNDVDGGGGVEVEEEGGVGWEGDLSMAPVAASTTMTTTAVARIDPSHGRGVDPWEDERQLILALAVIYLDRSSSVETPRFAEAEDPMYGNHVYARIHGQAHSPPGLLPPDATPSDDGAAPPLAPRTVHRSVLTAVSIAAKCVRSGTVGNVAGGVARSGSGAVPMSGGEISRALLTAVASASETGSGVVIAEAEFERMERAMLRAMGGVGTGVGGSGGEYAEEGGWIVRPHRMREFFSSWGRTFHPARVESREAIAIADAARASRRWERWVKERAAGAAAAVLGRHFQHDAGAPGGGGYYGYDHGHGGGWDPHHQHYSDHHHLHHPQQREEEYLQQGQNPFHGVAAGGGAEVGAEPSWGAPFSEAEAGDFGYHAAAAASWEQQQQQQQFHYHQHRQ